jgi:hypothetical protein
MQFATSFAVKTDFPDSSHTFTGVGAAALRRCYTFSLPDGNR